ncbi:MAG: hypothetical protein ACREX9_20975, partial [Gammaproteobacteria bacterium]
DPPGLHKTRGAPRFVEKGERKGIYATLGTIVIDFVTDVVVTEVIVIKVIAIDTLILFPYTSRCRCTFGFRRVVFAHSRGSFLGSFTSGLWQLG